MARHDAMNAEHDRRVLGDDAVRELDSDGRLRLVIQNVEVHRLPFDAALFVDLRLVRPQGFGFGVAEEREVAGQGEDHVDLVGLGGASRTGHQRSGDQRHDGER